MDDEISALSSPPHSLGRKGCHENFRSAEDYVYQLEYEKRKYLEQIAVLQQQLDLSDKRSSELSQELAAANLLNHRLKGTADENRKLQELVDELSQSEIILKKTCKELSASLADLELKGSLKEHEFKNLENELKNLQKHSSFQKDIILTAKGRFDSQQEDLECFLEKFERMSCRIVKLENDFNHIRSRTLDSKDELELLTQEKKSLLLKIKMLEEKSSIKCRFDDAGCISGEISDFDMNKCECKSLEDEIEFVINQASVCTEVDELVDSLCKEKHENQMKEVSSVRSSFLNSKYLIKKGSKWIAKHASLQNRLSQFLFLCLAAIFLLWMLPKISVLPSPLRIHCHPCHNTDCDFAISGFVTSLLGFSITKFNQAPPI